MAPDSPAQPDAAQLLATVAAALDRASAAAWARADAEGVFSPGHLLGLGVDTAACQARNLLPDHPDLPDHADPGLPGPVETDPLRLLRATERLLRSAPIEDFPPATSALVVSIGDLLRQTTP